MIQKCCHDLKFRKSYLEEQLKCEEFKECINYAILVISKGLNSYIFLRLFTLKISKLQKMSLFSFWIESDEVDFKILPNNSTLETKHFL